MDIDLDMTVLGIDEERQEALNHRQVVMHCPNSHSVSVRLTRGAGSSTIYCPECSEMVEPQIPQSPERT